MLVRAGRSPEELARESEASLSRVREVHGESDGTNKVPRVHAELAEWTCPDSVDSFSLRSPRYLTHIPAELAAR